MNSVVTRNSFQERFRQEHNEALAPDPFSTLEAPCTIIKVYDTETIESEGIPSGLSGLLRNYPGWLFAQVELQDNRTQLTLPFKEPAEHIYMLYGNYVQLEGRAATICYINRDIQNGCLIVRKAARNKHLALNTLSNVYDIGAII